MKKIKILGIFIILLYSISFLINKIIHLNENFKLCKEIQNPNWFTFSTVIILVLLLIFVIEQVFEELL